ncbi:MAG TPA: hypothetical protein VIK72_02370 [Clostridiaceae bacterium]
MFDYKWKSMSELPIQEGLPNFFKTDDEMTTKNWENQRIYLKEMLAHYLYGHIPPTPMDLHSKINYERPIYNGKGIERNFSIIYSKDDSLSFSVRLVYPSIKGSFPVIVKNSESENELCPIEEELIDRGYALATFNRVSIAKDSADRDNGIFKLYNNYDFGVIAAWAWGHSITIEHLLLLPFIDKEGICVTGHSRGAKAALCAAIYDDRIKVVAAAGSGSGGLGSIRFLGEHNIATQDPTKCESLGNIVAAFPYWWSKEIVPFANPERPHRIKDELRLPFDLHFIRALIAPRGVISTDGLEDYWTNPYGTKLSHTASEKAFNLFNARENNQIFFRSGGHAQNKEDWSAFLTFSDLVLKR